MSAVSISVTPASSAASITARVCSSSMRAPKLFVPRPTTETSGPPSPRMRVRIGSTLLHAVQAGALRTICRRMEGHPFVFLAGLHRSGTTLLARLLAAHPEISGFSGTDAPADEGQHLQSVYPAAKEYGGAGRVGPAAEADLTETQPLGSEGR